MSYLKEHDEHTASPATVIYLEVFEGRLQVEICDACHYLTVVCEHYRCSWDEAGETLTCNLCGDEGT